MNIIFVTGVIEVNISTFSYNTNVIEVDSSVVDKEFIKPYLPLVQSTLYKSLEKRFQPENKYNILFCGTLDKEKNEFSILESEVCNLKVEVEQDNDLSLNPFF